MPRGAQPPNPNRPQTLREARRAYQKAGRTPSLTAAQIRAAERAAEAEQRAKEILSKERRARDNKRKREEQETKQRSEQRRLVEQGKLPEESLWGKVRASQPRLHNFFGVPVDARQQAAENGRIQKDSDLDGGEERGEIEIDEEESPLMNQLFSSALSALESPTACHARDAEVSEGINGKLATGLGSQRRYADVADIQQTHVQLGLPASLSGSQLFSELADDAALEAELNGRSTQANNAHDQATPAGAKDVRHELVDDAAFEAEPKCHPPQAHMSIGHASPAETQGIHYEFVEDAALEAELNGSSTRAIESHHGTPPAGTQESQYDLDSVDDDDLAGLVDKFESGS
jgi:hypothetical protein